MVTISIIRSYQVQDLTTTVMGKQETLAEVRQDWTKHTGEERRGRDKLNKLDTRHTYYIFVVK